MNPSLIKNMALGILIGGGLGFIWHKVAGCSTGACPLTATPLRAIAYGAFMGLLLTSMGCNRQKVSAPPPQESSMTTSTASAIHLTVGAFEKIKAQTKPVLIDFWAPWCGPCRMQGPILDQVAAQMGEKAIIAKVNVDEERELAMTYGIQAIPTLIILKEGKIVQRMQGVQQANTLVQALEAHQ